MKKYRIKVLLLLGVGTMVWSITGLETVRSQSLAQMDNGFAWIDIMNRSRVLQEERDRQDKATQQKYFEVKGAVDEYNRTLEMTNLWVKLSDLKYRNLQTKYVLREHNLKLETEINKVEREIVDKTKRLKMRFAPPSGQAQGDRDAHQASEAVSR